MAENDPAPCAVLQLNDESIPPPLELVSAREARRAAGFVAALVVVPVVAAVAAVLALFVLTAVVLLAPAVALGVMCLVWQGSRPERPRALRLVKPAPSASPG
jgi:hypothetical protein